MELDDLFRKLIDPYGFARKESKTQYNYGTGISTTEFTE
jgi:hypothetical protein